MTDHSTLTGNFPESNETAWRARAETNGARLRVHSSDDDIGVGPIYARASENNCLWRRSAAVPWTIVQRVSSDRIDDAVEQLHDAIQSGADTVEFAFSGSAHPIVSQLDAAGSADLVNVANNSDGVGIRIDAGEGTTSIGTSFVRHLPAGQRPITFAFDPLATLAAQGWLVRSMMDLAFQAASAVKELARHNVTAMVADGRLWHAGGASEVQELAFVLASVVAHMRSLDGHGIALDTAADRIGLILAADTDQFLTIAKFRAMRLLHSRLREAAGLPLKPCRIHAETAWRMMTLRAPHTNLVRATGAAFAAAVGGADSICVLPFDLSTNDGADQARRLALNTQLILANEAHVGATADPGAGSGAIENLTDRLAEAAWAKFQEVEAQGGMAAAIREGTVQTEIAETRKKRLARIAAGETRLVGVNAFATDEGSEALPPAVSINTAPPDPAETATPMVFTRLSEAFERDVPHAGDGIATHE